MEKKNRADGGGSAAHPVGVCVCQLDDRAFCSSHGDITEVFPRLAGRKHRGIWNFDFAREEIRAGGEVAGTGMFFRRRVRFGKCAITPIRAQVPPTTAAAAR